LSTGRRTRIGRRNFLDHEQFSRLALVSNVALLLTKCRPTTSL
jgi:hypothetical protein